MFLLVSMAGSCLAGVFSPITYPDVPSTTCPGTQPLYFGLLMSFDAEQFDGSGAIAGVNVALDRINENCTLLPGYSLHYIVANSRVSLCVYRIYIAGSVTIYGIIIFFRVNGLSMYREHFYLCMRQKATVPQKI